MRQVLAFLIAAAALIAGISPAIAQAPAPVPALPDTQRLTAYTITAATGPYDVGFAIYGTGTTYSTWVEVWLNGVKLTPVTDWTLALTSGTLATAARPLTNARVTLTTPRTGTLQIVGARRPNRTSQFNENQGVGARALNQTITDLVAQNREQWDLINRAMMGRPGEVMNPLPAAAARVGGIVAFDITGQPTIVTIGLSNFTIPLLSVPNTWAQIQTFTGGLNSLNAVGVNTTTPGSQAAASGYPCFNTGPGHGCLDVGGVITLHAEQTAIYVYGHFASTAYFADPGLASWGYAPGLVDNHTFALLYTTDSFAAGGSSVQRAVWNPNWSYVTNFTSQAVNPSFNSGLATGWNFSGLGETNLISNTMSLGNKVFVFSDWNGATKLDLLSLTKDVAGGAALVGTSYPNPANIGQFNVNSGANNNVFVAGSSVSNTNMAAYYNSPVMFYQLTNNTVNNIFCEDFRSANVAKNSFAGICAQITDVTNGLVAGTLTFLTANGSSIASRALTISASGGVWAGSTLVDPGASSIGGLNVYSSNATFLMRTKTTLTDSAAAATATMTNAPTAGNPTKWFSIDDNGTTRRIPAW